MGAVVTGIGCLASLVVAFFAFTTASFAAWMTAFPSGLGTMTREQAQRQFRAGAAAFLVACLAGAWLMVRIVRGALRRRRDDGAGER